MDSLAKADYPPQPEKKEFENEIESKIEKLPEEMLAEIFSFLDKEDLAHIAQVSKDWGSDTMSNIMWKNLVATKLPEDYQKLPLVLLKDKFKAYHDDMKAKMQAKVDAANKYVKIVSFAGLSNPKLFAMLKSEDISLKDKCKEIDNEMKSHAFLLYSAALHGSDTSELNFDLLVAICDPNEYIAGNVYPTPIFNAVLYTGMNSGKLDFAYKLIDAGADITIKNPGGHTVFELARNMIEQGGNQPRGVVHPVLTLEQLDELEKYAQQVASKRAGR